MALKTFSKGDLVINSEDTLKIFAFFFGDTQGITSKDITDHDRAFAQALMVEAIQSSQDGKDRNVQLIIESHSEHFLNRLQRRVAEEKADPSDIAIYCAKRNLSKVNLEELEMNEVGKISNWPENYFVD